MTRSLGIEAYGTNAVTGTRYLDRAQLGLPSHDRERDV